MFTLTMSFIGSTIGSLLVEAIGFPWAAFCIAMMNVLQCLWIIGVMIDRRKHRTLENEIWMISARQLQSEGALENKIAQSKDL
ncbi:unnamed protein product [Soboliphyme baturini]|uniref:MFS domain-containing protein n=1 Tax=Soboliphyme baturini TaxID=241478 RepID=A0A183IA55_9BILA|nr:unnamed protein product [Soboliphyme baturini]